MPKRENTLLLFAVVLVGGALVFLKTDGCRQPSEPVAATATPLAPCVLSVRGTQQGPIVFPTEDGAKEFDNALTSRAGTDLVNQVIRLNAGVSVAWRTPCSTIDEGFSYSKIRVLDGPMVGVVGWVPTSQTRGN